MNNIKSIEETMYKTMKAYNIAKYDSEGNSGNSVQDLLQEYITEMNKYNEKKRMITLHNNREAIVKSVSTMSSELTTYMKKTWALANN